MIPNFNNLEYIKIPAGKIFDFNIEQDCSTIFPKLELSAVYNESYFNYKDKEKEGKNMENFEKILDRYKQYQIDFINADTETNIALIIEQSETEKIINKFKKQLIDELNKKYPNDEYKTDDIEIYLKFPKELEEKLENENEMHNTSIEVLESDINDAKLLLNAAQTYEQKMEILKNYKILDNEGRINIYEKE